MKQSNIINNGLEPELRKQDKQIGIGMILFTLSVILNLALGSAYVHYYSFSQNLIRQVNDRDSVIIERDATINELVFDNVNR